MLVTEHLAIGMPGGLELLIVLAVLLIFFGNRVPGVARSLGKGITEFKSGLREGDNPEDAKKDGEPSSRDASKKDDESSSHDA